MSTEQERLKYAKSEQSEIAMRLNSGYGRYELTVSCFSAPVFQCLPFGCRHFGKCRQVAALLSHH